MLQVNIPMDREEISGCVVQVVAKDHGKEKQHSTTVVVELVVKDENDHKPVFNKRNYFFSTLESTRPGSIVGSVSASDGDAFPYNVIDYRIQKYRSSLDTVRPLYYSANVLSSGSNSSQPHPNYSSSSSSSFIPSQDIVINSDHNMFSIDSITGDIILNFSLDKEKSDAYVFSVEAIENVDDSSFYNKDVATATVLVRIDDVNDHVPSFVYPPPGLTFKFSTSLNHSSNHRHNSAGTKQQNKSIEAQELASADNHSDSTRVTIGWVLAVDEDAEPVNSRVTYSLVDCHPFIKQASSSSLQAATDPGDEEIGSDELGLKRPARGSNFKENLKGPSNVALVNSTSDPEGQRASVDDRIEHRSSKGG